MKLELVSSVSSSGAAAFCTSWRFLTLLFRQQQLYCLLHIRGALIPLIWGKQDGNSLIEKYISDSGVAGCSHRGVKLFWAMHVDLFGRQQTGLEMRHWCGLQEGAEQTLLPDEAICSKILHIFCMFVVVNAISSAVMFLGEQHKSQWQSDKEGLLCSGDCPVDSRGDSANKDAS